MKSARGVWGMGHSFGNKLYFTRDIPEGKWISAKVSKMSRHECKGYKWQWPTTQSPTQQHNEPQRKKNFKMGGALAWGVHWHGAAVVEGVVALPFTSHWMLKKSPSSFEGPTTTARILSNVLE